MANKKINNKAVYKNVEVYNHMGFGLKKGMFKKKNMLYLALEVLYIALEDLYYETKYQLKRLIAPVKKLIGFFNNIYLFRKNLWYHNKYDAMESLSIFNASMKIVANGMEKVGDNGFEFGKRRLAINEATQLIDKLLRNDYLNLSEMTETNLSEKLRISMEEEEKDLKRLMVIIKNRNHGIMSWWY